MEPELISINFIKKTKYQIKCEPHEKKKIFKAHFNCITYLRSGIYV